MTVTCFVSYEIHPTNVGGCGVLIHHAADILARDGNEVVLLLDIAPPWVRQFRDKDRFTLKNPEACRVYCVDELCADLPVSIGEIPSSFQWKAVRFAHALRKVQEVERLDYVEFFEYCGVGYYAFAQRLFAAKPGEGVLGARLHGAIELFDKFGSVRDTDRLVMHGIERRALALSEAVLTPSRTYFDYYCGIYDLEPQAVVVSSPPKQAARVVKNRPSPKGPFAVVFVGRMFDFKGVEQLVRASIMLMEERPNLDFTVEMMGYDSTESPNNGSYSKYLQTLMPQKLRDRFIFTGFLSHEQISDRLENALFGVFANRIESFCYALHEVYDSGVPVIANELPAFTDFFEHERNALIFHGDTSELLAAMKRMIDDDALRQRLTRPYPVADRPIGDFYGQPKALVPLVPDADKEKPVSPLVAVLCEGPDFAGSPALASLARQTMPATRILCLIPGNPGEEETLWWLGRPWHIRTPDSKHVPMSDVVTTDALAVIESGDMPAPTWLESCARALSRRPAMAFAGTWGRCEGRVVTSTLDLVPELYPFERPNDLARILVRTKPGVLLGDLFDPGLRALGHLGYVWWAIAKWGHGVLVDTMLIDLKPSVAQAPDTNAIRALIMRFGTPFSEKLSLIAGLLADRSVAAAPEQQPAPPPPLPKAPPTVEQKIALADELGGRTLARLALKKLTRRVVTPVRQGE